MILDEKNPNTYELATFDSEEDLEAASAIVTHHGACGLCSTLEDLAVYMSYNDLTQPVRECGFIGVTEGDEANIQCLQDLGFTLPCAMIWFYNTVNTRENCMEICMDLLDDPYHEKDCSINECLQCVKRGRSPPIALLGEGQPGELPLRSDLPDVEIQYHPIIIGFLRFPKKVGKFFLKLPKRYMQMKTRKEKKCIQSTLNK